ncbi:SSI family serine proteinase inhibitor [Nocardia sp. NPDC052316]|uniref:SSI family serine proteinase inhibitor n=1 Tax=Nocardia sp. NPDC052316 TaxID=3364329 RepID=UPI0037CA5515
MTTPSLRRTSATVCFVLVALACAACTADDTNPAKSILTLSVSPQAPGSAGTRVALTCEPTGGEHPAADAACAALTAADGDFDKLAGDPTAVCVQVYEPVTAIATGTWRGRSVTWEKTFGNKCELSARTTPVF